MIQMSYKSICVAVCMFVFSAVTVQANVIVRTADQLEVAEGDIVDGELVAVGLPVVLSNNVAEDATLIGNRVKINGIVGGDLLAAGFFVDVDANVVDDVRIVGGEVAISSAISGDLIVLGGAVDLRSTASVAGDVIVYGGTVTIAGPVAGDVVGMMESLTINSSVAGGVDVSVTNFSLGDQAAITEAIEYTSYNVLSQSFNATVGGAVVRSDPPMLQESGWPQMAMMTFLIGLFSALIWHLVARRSLTAVVGQTTTHLLRSAFVGFLTPLLAIIVAAVLIISQLGFYIAMVVLFGFTTLLLLSVVAAPAVVGQLLFKSLNQSNTRGPLPIVIGVLILTCCVFVPVIGVWLLLAAFIVTLGGLVEALFKANR